MFIYYFIYINYNPFDFKNDINTNNNYISMIKVAKRKYFFFVNLIPENEKKIDIVQ